MRRVALAGLVAVALVLGSASPGRSAVGDPIPVLAYYYIWFNPTSWNRAKTDYPLLGRYSSDEQRVMRQHIRWAKQAGIDGFIVSWKSTPILNYRLQRLIDAAAAENFKLVMIYQGLDFDREPLPVKRIGADLALFDETFGSHDVFDLFGKPVMIWSGTWRFARSSIERLAHRFRNDMLLLSSEQSVEEYARLRGVVDGNAYYWSSVDPAEYETYWQRLVDMGRAVHEEGGLWIAPVAPGFDARLVGGSSVVPRRDGDTLRLRMDGAMRSSPDAIGVISWNEFSENTHVEPSRSHGYRYLEVLADIDGAQIEVEGDLDSSELLSGDAPATGIGYGTPMLAGLVTLLFAVGIGALARSRRGSRLSSGMRR